MEYYVSIDIGGTSIKYGILTVDGEILEKSSIRNAICCPVSVSLQQVWWTAKRVRCSSLEH